MIGKGDEVINKRSKRAGMIWDAFPYTGIDSNWQNTTMYYIHMYGINGQRGRFIYVLEGELQRLYEIIPRGEGLIAR